LVLIDAIDSARQKDDLPIYLEWGPTLRSPGLHREDPPSPPPPPGLPRCKGFQSGTKLFDLDGHGGQRVSAECRLDSLIQGPGQASFDLPDIGGVGFRTSAEIFQNLMGQGSETPGVKLPQVVAWLSQSQDILQRPQVGVL
jgi:hypothetical protein